MDKQFERVVILGGGVAGSALAVQLARAGRQVHIVEHPSKPDLVVGESLLPPVTALLRELGVEERVREYSTLKPGIAFIMRTGRILELNLRRLQGLTATYAYNVPRPRFDADLRLHAQRQGARFVEHRVKPVWQGEQLALERATLDACGLQAQPDLVIDATGRARLIGRALRLPGTAGPRKDVCVFAHYENVDLGVQTPGCSVLTAMRVGWAWRIPLPERMSVGVVQDTAHFAGYGSTPEERLERALADDPIMAEATRKGRRLTPARVYTNYQWRYHRLRGPNWILLGDAAGFVDPTLSSGVLLALQAALSLAKALTSSNANAKALRRWEHDYMRKIAVWQELVDCFYDGRLFSLIMQGEDYSKNERLGPLNRHMERNVAGAILGARTDHWYSQRLLRTILQRGLVRYQPGAWCIRDRDSSTAVQRPIVEIAPVVP